MDADKTPLVTRNHHLARTEMTERLKEFHRYAVKQTDRATVLKIYCTALCQWMGDPNIDLYQAERLLDEIRHASELEALDDWDEE